MLNNESVSLFHHSQIVHVLIMSRLTFAQLFVTFQVVMITVVCVTSWVERSVMLVNVMPDMSGTTCPRHVKVSIYSRGH